MVGEARLQQLAEALPHIVWVSAPNGDVVFVNARGTAYIGLPPERAFGRRWIELVHPDDMGHAVATWDAALASGSSFHSDYRLRRHDGEYRSIYPETSLSRSGFSVPCRL